MKMQVSGRGTRACARAAVVVTVGLMASGWGLSASAAPYASGVTIGGNTVTFTLNEAADSLTYSINGGAAQSLDASSAGTKTFNLTSPTDKFTITAKKNDAVGYTIPTGDTLPAAGSGLSQPTALAGTRQISDNANPFTRYNSPRGVSVATNPNLPTFGNAYISNSAAGTTTGVVRSVGDGIYAVKADQSDALGFGDTAQNPGGVFDTVSTSSPFRTTVARDGSVYVADFSDSRGNVFRLTPNLGAAAQVFAGTGGPTALPAGQNHGSTTAVYVEGSSAAGNLVVYTLDEDLKSSQFGGAAGDDRNSLWRYDIGNAALPYTGIPTKINAANVLIPLASSDLDRGADGKFYLAQNRSAGNESGLVVLSSDGSQVLFDSLAESRTLLGNPTATDILQDILAMAVSPDQKYVALMLNDSDVAVVPLVDGVPQLANRMVVDNGTDINSGRDIAFDAAGNIHYVSSGQAMYRVLSPGGNQESSLVYDGSTFSFVNGPLPVPEPTSLSLLGLGAIALARRNRRR
jgi:hypothetical protein